MSSPGRPAVYLGDSLALAAMELLVHLGTVETLDTYREIPVYVSDELVVLIEPGELPTGWESCPRTTIPAIGDRWLAGQ